MKRVAPTDAPTVSSGYGLATSPELDRYDRTPPYVAFFDTLKEYTKINRFILYLLVSIFPYVLFIPLALIFGWDANAFSSYWMRLNFSGWALGTFLFMNHMYRRTIVAYPLLSYLARTPYNKNELVSLYNHLFLGRSQTITCVITGILCTLTGLCLDLNLSGPPRYYIIVNSFFVGYLLGYGMWYCIGISTLILHVGKMRNVKVNYLNPFYSVGVVEMPELASIWSLCFFFEAIIVYVGLVLPDWTQSATFLGAKITSLVQVFWLIVFLGIAIYNFVNPISAVSRLASDAKMNIKIMIIDKLYKLYMDVEADVENLSLTHKDIVSLAEFYEKVVFSRSKLFDWAVFVRFLATSIPTVLIVVIEHFDTLERIIQFVKKGR
jgi:hypothetical protein